MKTNFLEKYTIFAAESQLDVDSGELFVYIYGTVIGDHE